MLKLNGAPFVKHQLTPTTRKIIAFLDKSPADEVFTRQVLADKLGINVSSLTDLGAKAEFSTYTAKIGALRYWGHPKAIVALRKELGVNA